MTSIACAEPGALQMNLLDLGDDARESVVRGAKQATYARGDAIYRVGDAASFVYFVTAGRVKIVRPSASGAESIVGIRNPGDIFGEISWMADAAARTTDAIALDQSEIVRLESAEFEKRLRDDVAVASAFARGVVRRLTTSELELSERAGKSVPGRLVDVLGRLASDHGVPEPDGSLRIGISLTHQDLADLIGTSRETLTRELSVLADVGLVRVSHRTVTLVQPRAFPFLRREII